MTPTILVYMSFVTQTLQKRVTNKNDSDNEITLYSVPLQGDICQLGVTDLQYVVSYYEPNPGMHTLMKVEANPV